MPSSEPFETTLHTFMDVYMRRSMRNFIFYLKENGLSISQIGALFHVRRGSGGVSDLGEELGVTNAAASQMLERLVQQKLVTRSEDPHDRRAKQIVLTDKGREILHESILARQSWIDTLVNTLSAEEKAQITAALNILIEKANQLEDQTEKVPEVGIPL